MSAAPRLIGAVLLAALSAGCLEVNQYPPYENGMYAGKKDDLQFQRVYRDKAAWSAAIAARERGQNEYLRVKP